MTSILKAFLCFLVVAAAALAGPTESDLRKPLPIVHPVEGHTRLQLDQEGLSALRSITTPVVPVVVIGPYRSGKSFLLNQLLGVGCDEGFGVGHTRSTQTKGVWVWGQPTPLRLPSGQDLSLVFIDTEGFESTGKADAYDDRIFALSALISSLLIYNLPEAIRESDIQKLSFAVDLAEGFYSQSQGAEKAPMDAANMLWLIQRDFLEGASLQAMLAQALSAVDNPAKDRDIEQVNRIRQSLQVMAANSSTFGLRQPHLARTRLCELPDEDLDPGYVRQRGELHDLVNRLAKPKVVNGAALNGTGLARLIEQMVTALNARDIPTAGSILEHFNKELMYKVQEEHERRLGQVQLPADEGALQRSHEAAVLHALARFDAEKFGNLGQGGAGPLRGSLTNVLIKQLDTRVTANRLASTEACNRLEQECEDGLEREQKVHLPSTSRFAAHYQRCRLKFDVGCIGPARADQAGRLDKAWKREERRFRQDYNDKLFNGLILVLLLDIVVSRFLLKSNLLESIGWILFVFLQVYPKLYLSGGSMYDSSWWQLLVQGWELMVYNPILDLEQTWQILIPTGLLAYICWKCWQKYLRPRWSKRKARSKTLPLHTAGPPRDLDV
ncbi:hypothetical protein WJX84_001038 [Apatococcus fuscideae]|uniref:GB1/RHD3-type G domain-containing protein n=1 Tax=Apatococcus fuscideae TaxID=2026836 RepID=A0AAW1THV8_9CHLO